MADRSSSLKPREVGYIVEKLPRADGTLEEPPSSERVPVARARQVCTQELTFELDVDAISCEVCLDGGDEHILLLCEGCHRGFHTRCVGLEEVPDDDYYCVDCVASLDAEGPSSAVPPPQGPSAPLAPSPSREGPPESEPGAASGRLSRPPPRTRLARSRRQAMMSQIPHAEDAAPCGTVRWTTRGATDQGPSSSHEGQNDTSGRMLRSEMPSAPEIISLLSTEDGESDDQAEAGSGETNDPPPSSSGPVHQRWLSGLSLLQRDRQPRNDQVHPLFRIPEPKGGVHESIGAEGCGANQGGVAVGPMASGSGHISRPTRKRERRPELPSESSAKRSRCGEVTLRESDIIFRNRTEGRASLGEGNPRQEGTAVRTTRCNFQLRQDLIVLKALVNTGAAEFLRGASHRSQYNELHTELCESVFECLKQQVMGGASLDSVAACVERTIVELSGPVLGKLG
ncbi:hypothetical protein BSKO_11926 [Bryopsis sp. KO-2023]|nr:hypothetical protein BSKO_11926 [Bryopsis sp. KO-2023]